ncbi:MAG: flagellar biosynthesis protein FlhF [Firmicutes bacterium]|nr:flagellar biosynthesis protein FlhF [Bacillota bacterium]
MRVKRFVGKSMKEAVAQLKATFGDEAVILHTKRSRSGPFGLFGRPRVEIIAALDVAPKPTSPPVNSSELQLLQQELREVKGLLASQSKETGPWQSLYEELVAGEVDPKNAKDLLDKMTQVLPPLSPPEEAAAVLKEILAEEIRVVPPWNLAEGTRVVALVGPTGVGKTTTIAKIAANYALLAKRRVSLLTMDTYRIAAAEQLKTYAEIIGVPLEVVFTPQALREALERHKHSDLILIDTAGRSQHNKMHLAELKAFLDQAQPDEVHLVLSATTKTRDAMEIIDGFAAVLPLNRLIITKLDETSSYGMILNACRHLGQPLAYVTTGQSVPEDIEVADPNKIADLILGG